MNPCSGGRKSRAREAVLLGVLVGLSWGLASPAWAHEKQPKPAPKPLHHVVPSDSGPGRTDSLPPGSRASDSTPAAAPAPFPMPPFIEAVGHHLHNKLVHFPIVLAPLALFSLILSRRRPGLAGPALVFSWLGAVSAGAALWAGLGQAPDFEGEPKEWLVMVHRNWGIATTAALVVTALLAPYRRTRWLALGAALLAVVLVSWVAYLGGLIAHG